MPTTSTSVEFLTPGGNTMTATLSHRSKARVEWSPSALSPEDEHTKRKSPSPSNLSESSPGPSSRYNTVLGAFVDNNGDVVQERGVNKREVFAQEHPTRKPVALPTRKSPEPDYVFTDGTVPQHRKHHDPFQNRTLKFDEDNVLYRKEHVGETVHDHKPLIRVSPTKISHLTSSLDSEESLKAAQKSMSSRTSPFTMEASRKSPEPVGGRRNLSLSTARNSLRDRADNPILQLDASFDVKGRPGKGLVSTRPADSVDLQIAAFVPSPAPVAEAHNPSDYYGISSVARVEDRRARRLDSSAENLGFVSTRAASLPPAHEAYVVERYTRRPPPESKNASVGILPENLPEPTYKPSIKVIGEIHAKNYNIINYEGDTGGREDKPYHVTTHGQEPVVVKARKGMRQYSDHKHRSSTLDDVLANQGSEKPLGKRTQIAEVTPQRVESYGSTQDELKFSHRRVMPERSQHIPVHEEEPTLRPLIRLSGANIKNAASTNYDIVNPGTRTSGSLSPMTGRSSPSLW